MHEHDAIRVAPSSCCPNNNACPGAVLSELGEDTGEP